MKHLLHTLFLSLISMSVLATVHQVNSGMFYYTPSELTIHVGDTVVWINDGGTHDVNANVNSQTGESFNNPENFQSNVTFQRSYNIYSRIYSSWNL